ncbi:hypothetical protein ACFX2I_003020 [Malus domestica]
MGDCGCADAKDAVKPSPAPLPKQQNHVDAPSRTKVEGDAVALGGPNKFIAANPADQHIPPISCPLLLAKPPHRRRKAQSEETRQRKLTTLSSHSCFLPPPTGSFREMVLKVQQSEGKRRSEDYRKDFQKQNPGVKQMREIGKAGGEKWNTMAYELS